MAMDTRHWYRDLLRKRTGYVERSAFRLPASESELKKPFKLHATWLILGGLALGLLLLVVARVVLQLAK